MISAGLAVFASPPLMFGATTIPSVKDVQPQTGEVAQQKPDSAGTLSMFQAIRLAEVNNGSIRSGIDAYRIARERRAQSFAAFLPTLTAGYNYNSDRIQTSSGFNQNEGSNTTLTANWNILDLGQRSNSFLSARRNEDAAYYSAYQNYRQILFNVQQQFIETLRSQQLEVVAKAQYDRAKTVYDQTIQSINAQVTPAKNKFQAAADLANAKVTELQARNQVISSSASLKALIGIPSSSTLPALTEIAAPDIAAMPSQLSDVQESGINRRPDLMSQRLSLEALRFDARLAAENAGLQFNLSASFSESWSSSRFESRYASLTLSYPIFDGGALRAQVREANLSVDGAIADLSQSEKNARSEIETAFLQLSQNKERLDAAEQALVAAQQNYAAVDDAYRLGASTIIDVLTASVSLVTAESNEIQAKYDFEESNLSLKLATGQKLYGEESLDEVFRRK